MVYQDDLPNFNVREPDVISILAELAMIYHSYGKHKEADDIHKVLLQLRGNRSIQSLRRLRDFYAAQGRQAQSTEIERILVEVRASTGGSAEDDEAAS